MVNVLGDKQVFEKCGVVEGVVLVVDGISLFAIASMHVLFRLAAVSAKRDGWASSEHEWYCVAYELNIMMLLLCLCSRFVAIVMNLQGQIAVAVVHLECKDSGGRPDSIGTDTKTQVQSCVT